MSFVLLLLLRTKSNCFLGRGNGGVFTARRRWRFDTSIFRISKVDPPINPLRNRILTFRDPVLDHLFAHFLNLWKPPNWRSWRHDQNKSAIWRFFGANSQCIYDHSVLRFSSFLINQLRFALLPCTVYLVLIVWNRWKPKRIRWVSLKMMHSKWIKSNCKTLLFYELLHDLRWIRLSVQTIKIPRILSTKTVCFGGYMPHRFSNISQTINATETPNLSFFMKIRFATSRAHYHFTWWPS